MSNMTYLCGTNDEKIYPSMRSSFKEEQQVISAAKYSLPIMWVLLFEDSDVVEATVTKDDDNLDLFAPLASKEKALGLFDKNAARISKLFDASRFEGYRSLFRKEIERMPFQFVTIELDELDGMERDGELRTRLTSLYSELECASQRSSVAKWLGRPPKLLQQLCHLSGYTSKRGLPEAECLIKENHSGRELENHWSMLGFNWQKATTWDPSVEIRRGTSEDLLPQGSAPQGGEAVAMQPLIEELSKQVHSLDWDGQYGACDEAQMIADLWDDFVELGDADWEFGNTLVHQGTLYPAVFLLVPSLIALAKSQHPHRQYALDILGACLMSSGGCAAYQGRLAAHLPVPNPFKPGEMMSMGSAPPQGDIGRERELMRAMRTEIEAEFDVWMRLAKEPDREVRLAAIGILAGVINHPDQELAEQVVRDAFEQATDEKERNLLEWYCSHLDDDDDEQS